MKKKRPQQARALFHAFVHNEKSAGILLILCTVVSLLVANSASGHRYIHFWHSDIFGKPLEFWINDGLMAVFFLLVGLEIKQELIAGQLSDRKQAMLPVIAALGGMIVPALIHFGFNHGLRTQPGIGIPMATDIAFSLGILSLLGKKVPVAMKVFLTALAIIDDLGAIVVIALFYSNGFSPAHFGVALAIFALMLFLNKRGVNRIFPYLILGCVMWYFMTLSGIHATITGVLTAFAVPFLRHADIHPSEKLLHALHLPVTFVILPLFALSNTGIVIENDWMQQLGSVNSLGIAAGLIVGKPLGIIGFSLLGKALRFCHLPEGESFLAFTGIALLAGIGFTMSIFISLLAFDDPDYVNSSKIAILAASGASALLGYGVLRIALKK